MKQLLTIILVLLLGNVFAQLNTTTFDKLDSLQAIEKKPVYVFIHTTWCNICLMMEETTLKDKEIVNRLNSHFYVILFDAETESTITFLEKSYSNPINKTHELALFLTNNQTVYPTSCFLKSNLEIVIKKEGLLKKAALLETINMLLNY